MMSMLRNVFSGPRGAERIEGREAWRRVREEGALLVDVRTEEEFAEGHAEGARNIPLHELAHRMGELTPGRAVVLYCRSGVRSATAGTLLARQGIEAYDAGGIGSLR